MVSKAPVDPEDPRENVGNKDPQDPLPTHPIHPWQKVGTKGSVYDVAPRGPSSVGNKVISFPEGFSE